MTKKFKQVSETQRPGYIKKIFTITNLVLFLQLMIMLKIQKNCLSLL